MTEPKKNMNASRLLPVLAVLLLALAVVLLLRGNGSPTGTEAAQLSPVPAPTQQLPPQCLPEPEPAAVPPEPEETPEPLPAPQQEAEQADAAQTPEPVPAPERRPIVYDRESLRLVNDMVYAYKYQVKDRDKIIAADVAALKEHEPRLGKAWGGIMEYWDYANSRMEIHYGELPEDLPRDDSLCLAVLGFKLTPEGEMSDELLSRCVAALNAARQYPEAYLLVTGGGTAYLHPEMTEAGVMRDWFLQQGIAAERLILEDRSTTTEENARYSLQILTRDYPRIKNLVIISSDYHLPLGCLLFTEAALLYECEYGLCPFQVLSNLGVRQEPLPGYDDPKEQMLYVWTMADPRNEREKRS